MEIVMLVFFIIGTVFSIIGLSFLAVYSKKKKKMASADIVNGEIIELEKRWVSTDHGKRIAYFPVIEYWYDSEERLYRSNTEFKLYKAEIGSTVELYVCADGDVFDNKGIFVFRILSSVFTAFGVVLLILATIFSFL